MARPVTDGDWHHLAGVIGQKAGLVAIYVDGVRSDNRLTQNQALTLRSKF